MRENGIFLGFAGVESMVFLGTTDGDGWESGQAGSVGDAGMEEGLILSGSEGSYQDQDQDQSIPLGVRKCLGTHSRLAVIPLLTEISVCFP